MTLATRIYELKYEANSLNSYCERCLCFNQRMKIRNRLTVLRNRIKELEQISEKELIEEFQPRYLTFESKINGEQRPHILQE